MKLDGFISEGPLKRFILLIVSPDHVAPETMSSVKINEYVVKHLISSYLINL